LKQLFCWICRKQENIIKHNKKKTIFRKKKKTKAKTNKKQTKQNKTNRCAIFPDIFYMEHP